MAVANGEMWFDRYFILLLQGKTATKIVNPSGGGADVTIGHQIFDQRILRVGKIQRAGRHFAQSLRRLSRVHVAAAITEPRSACFTEACPWAGCPCTSA